MPRSKRKLFILSVILPLLAAGATAQEKLSADEVLSRHIASIGAKEKRDAAHDRVISGRSLFSILRSSAGTASGKVVVFSQNEKLSLLASFGSSSYPVEQISYDSKKAAVAFISPGNRSPLGHFILSHSNIVSGGLLTGSLSSSWALLDLKGRKAKLSYAGRKKIDGRDAYALDYLPGGGSDLSIRLYFDAATFQHIRTEYSQTLSAAQGLTPDASSRQVEQRQQLVENFSDYSAESGLMLPHSYRISLTLTGGAGTSEYEWKFALTTFAFDQAIDPESFEIGG